MTTLEQVTELNPYPNSKAGTVDDLAEMVADSLVMSGYSLSQDDVKNIILMECHYYAGWAMFEAQKSGVIKIDGALLIDTFEWGILEPSIRTHINLTQARQMEAVKSTGAMEFGLTVSEAEQYYQQERSEMPRLAFVAEPYAIELD